MEGFAEPKSEGLSGPQPGTPPRGVQRNPTTNILISEWR